MLKKDLQVTMGDLDDLELPVYFRKPLFGYPPASGKLT